MNLDESDVLVVSTRDSLGVRSTKIGGAFVHEYTKIAARYFCHEARDENSFRLEILLRE